MIHNIRSCKKIKIVCGFVVTLLPILLYGRLATLEDLQLYAKTYPEDVKSDNNDPQYPNFMNAYKKEKMGLFETIKNYFSRKPIARFSADEFKTLLDEVIAIRASQKNNREVVIKLPPQGIIVFWGSLFGSFHSLVRTLTELYHKEIINNDLEIIKKDCYFCFLGDAINFSPYTLVTLSVILLLMKKNQDKIFYIEGHQEHNSYWENFTMRSSLKVFASKFLQPEDFSIPLSTSLKKFFSTLPEVVIINREPEEKEQSFYALHTIIDEKILKQNAIELLLLGEREVVPKETSGLEFMGYDYGTAIWSLMSCPNTIYQDFYKFYYDSFVIFEMGEKLLSSILTVFNQDVRKQNGFIPESFDVLYGIKLNNKDEVKKLHEQRPLEIGSTMPLYGASGLTGQSVSNGLNASMYNYNKTNGRALDLLIRNNIFDDQLIPRNTRANVKILHNEYQLDYLLAPVGITTLATYLPNLEKENMFVFFPFAGDAASRNLSLKNIIHLRASQADEVHALIDYMIAEYRSRRFAFFYQNDAYGKDALEAAHNELSKRGITNWTIFLIRQIRPTSKHK